jgi:sigma-B regulation protein RsbU (phosphoserine phosphatase)
MTTPLPRAAAVQAPARAGAGVRRASGARRSHTLPGSTTTTPLGLAVSLAVVLVLHTAAIHLRPAGSDWSTFWPASGVAVALASTFRGRSSWSVVVAIGAVSALGSLISGRELLLVFGTGLAVSLEMWVGRRILRTGADRDPRLDTTRDLLRLFLAAPAAAVTIAVVAGTAAAVSRGPEVFLPLVVSTVPAHTVGILLVAPLLIQHWRVRPAAGRIETAAVWASFLIVVRVAFGLDVGVSMVFLVVAPLAWAAVRLSRLGFQWMMLATAVAATASSFLPGGPFNGAGVDEAVTALAIQLFDLSFGLALLTLIVVVAQRRRLAETVEESEGLFRTTFDSSLVGMAIVSRSDHGLTAERMNSAGRDILGVRDGEIVTAEHQLDDPSLLHLQQALATQDADGKTAWQGILTTQAGRSLDLRVTSLSGASYRDELSVQFLDVTDRVTAEAAAEADLLRAGEVQRALLPRDTAPLDGYEVSGICVPSKTVGGDFYDWYAVKEGLAFTLGDVMGKGVGAGMIAATARAALRSARRDADPTVAVLRVAETLETEVAEEDSFTTLFHARLRAEDGRMSFVDAGHGLIVLVRADGSFRRISGGDMPIGVTDGGGYSAHEEVLEPGDMLVVVSDGVLDLYDGTLVALDIVADMARRAGTPAALIGIFTELALHDAAPDDVTVLAIRRND